MAPRTRTRKARDASAGRSRSLPFPPSWWKLGAVLLLIVMVVVAVVVVVVVVTLKAASVPGTTTAPATPPRLHRHEQHQSQHYPRPDDFPDVNTNIELRDLTQLASACAIHRDHEALVQSGLSLSSSSSSSAQWPAWLTTSPASLFDLTGDDWMMDHDVCPPDWAPHGGTLTEHHIVRLSKNVLQARAAQFLWDENTGAQARRVYRERVMRHVFVGAEGLGFKQALVWQREELRRVCREAGIDM